MTHDYSVRYRIWICGQTTYFKSLLPALEMRKAVIAAGAQPENISVEERQGNEWAYFDVDSFLTKLERLFVPR